MSRTCVSWRQTRLLRTWSPLRLVAVARAARVVRHGVTPGWLEAVLGRSGAYTKSDAIALPLPLQAVRAPRRAPPRTGAEHRSLVRLVPSALTISSAAALLDLQRVVEGLGRRNHYPTRTPRWIRSALPEARSGPALRRTVRARASSDRALLTDPLGSRSFLFHRHLSHQPPDRDSLVRFQRSKKPRRRSWRLRKVSKRFAKAALRLSTAARSRRSTASFTASS